MSEDKRCAQNDAKCETKTRSRFVLVRGTKALRYRLTQKFPRVDLVMAYTLAAN